MGGRSIRWSRISEWIDIETLKVLSHHASGVIAAIVLFGTVGVFVDSIVRQEPLRTVLKVIDSFVLVGLVLWLAFQLARLLWNRRV
jgi:hypothetical protein